MSEMSRRYAATGRAAQKGRTRDALVAAARELVAAGETPTVEDAARAASVSRATAYRYFPTQRDLLVAAHPEMTATTMLPPDPPADPVARLDAVVDAFTAMIVDTKEQQRTMLRLSLEQDPVRRGGLPLRQGRAIGWITEALEGLRRRPRRGRRSTGSSSRSGPPPGSRRWSGSPTWPAAPRSRPAP